MHAEAHIVYDRQYYHTMYDDWLVHRSVLRRYATPLSVIMISAGVAMSFQAPKQWLAGAVVAAFGVYELIAAITHKQRWIKQCLSGLRQDKSVDLTFTESCLQTSSVNSNSTINYSGFQGFITATNGFFLVPETGISLYIPKSAVLPVNAYDLITNRLTTVFDEIANGSFEAIEEAKPQGD